MAGLLDNWLGRPSGPGLLGPAQQASQSENLGLGFNYQPMPDPSLAQRAVGAIREFSDSTGNTDYWRNVFAGNNPAALALGFLTNRPGVPLAPNIRALRQDNGLGKINFKLVDDARPGVSPGDGFTLRNKDGDAAHWGFVHMEPEYRGTGLSQKLYDLAAKTNGRLVPDEALSPEAYGLWQKRDPSTLSGHTLQTDVKFPWWIAGDAR